MFTPIAASANAAVTGDRIWAPKSVNSELRKPMFTPLALSCRSWPLPDALSAAEDSLRPEEQDDDQDDERGRVLEVLGKHEARHLHDDADHERSDESAERRPK